MDTPGAVQDQTRSVGDVLSSRVRSPEQVVLQVHDVHEVHEEVEHMAYMNHDGEILGRTSSFFE